MKPILSVSGLSILASVLLALWEVYFFWMSGSGDPPAAADQAGLARTGMSLAWLTTLYLSFQLLSIPFSVGGSRGRFFSVLDSMASSLPLLIVVIVLFDRSDALGSAHRWEVALLLLVVNSVDLFGGFLMALALSRRTIDYIGSPAS